MKTVYRVILSGLLLLLTQSTWAFSFGLESANPLSILQFIEGNHAAVYLSAFFGLGLLLAFTPCVLPMVPILSGIIVGQESLSTGKALRLSCSYVLGMALTYAAAGLIAGYLGSTVQTLMQNTVVIIGFSLLFVAMALSMLGWFELRLPGQRAAGINANSKRSWLSVAGMGVLSTLVVSPCVTAPLIGVLTYIGQNGQALMGGVILFVMALGMGLPLILVGAGYGRFLPKTGAWMIKIKALFGYMMLGIAIWMLQRVLPESVTNCLWAVLLLAVAINLFNTPFSAILPKRLFQGMGLVAVGLGGNIVYHTPFNTDQILEANATSWKSIFTEVSTLSGIEQQLKQAAADKKPVFIDFSASWCSDCQALDAEVFSQADVATALKPFVNLRVEISEKTHEVAAIKKAFGIYGTPTLLFYNDQGIPLNQFTAVGLIDKKAFMTLLHQVNAAQ